MVTDRSRHRPECGTRNRSKTGSPEDVKTRTSLAGATINQLDIKPSAVGRKLLKALGNI
jgi:hypothetical protein